MKKQYISFAFISSCVFLLAACNNSGPKYEVFTVTFDGEPTYVLKGEYAVQPDEPAKSDHYFIGWYENSTLYNFELPVTRNIDLVSQFLPYKNEVHGSVSDIINSSLSGATVSCGNQTAIVEENNEFTLKNVKMGNYEITVSKEGYENSYISLNAAQFDKEGKADVGNIAMKKSYVNVGTIGEMNPWNLSLTRDGNGIYFKADTAERSFYSNNRFELWFTTGEVSSAVRNADTYMLQYYFTTQAMALSNYPNNVVNRILSLSENNDQLSFTSKTTEGRIYLEGFVNYSVFEIDVVNEVTPLGKWDVFGYTFTLTEGANNDLYVYMLDGKEVVRGSRTQYVRFDAGNKSYRDLDNGCVAEITGKLDKDARVITNKSTYYPDDNNNYKAEAKIYCFDSPFSIKYAKTGYCPIYKDVFFDLSLTKVIDVTEFKDELKQNISGVVKSAYGKNIEGAIVKFASFESSTDNNGEFNFYNIPSQDDVLTIEKSGFAPYEQPISADDFENPIVINATLALENKLIGSISNNGVSCSGYVSRDNEGIYLRYEISGLDESSKTVSNKTEFWISVGETASSRTGNLYLITCYLDGSKNVAFQNYPNGTLANHTDRATIVKNHAKTQGFKQNGDKYIGVYFIPYSQLTKDADDGSLLTQNDVFGVIFGMTISSAYTMFSSFDGHTLSKANSKQMVRVNKDMSIYYKETNTENN